MPPKQQQQLNYQIVWSSPLCEEFPPENLLNNTDDNGNNSFFQTPRPTDRVILRLDFQQNVCILGCIASSSSASHIEIRSSNTTNDHSSKLVLKNEQQNNNNNNNNSTMKKGGFGALGHQVVEKKQFVGPLSHRTRLAKLRETGAARPPPITVMMQSVLTESYKRKHLAGGDRDKYQQILELKAKQGMVDPPHFVQMVDVDIRGIWEPHQRLGLDSLKFVGYVVDDEEVKEYEEKVKKIKNDYAAASASLQQQQKTENKKAGTEEENSSSLKVESASPTVAGTRRAREEEDDKDKNYQEIHLQAPVAPKPYPKIAAKKIDDPTPSTHQAQQAVICETGKINNDDDDDQKWNDLVNQKPDPSSQLATNNHQIQKQDQKQEKPKFTDKPLTGVTFVLSGFQNPLRGQLRDKAVKLGAKYSSDWNSNTCTHLICVTAGTPKYQEVQMSGVGKIVKKEWVDDCELYGEKCDEKKYIVGDGGPGI